MSTARITLNEVFDRHYVSLVAWCRKRVRRELGEPEELVHLAYVRCSRRWQAGSRSRHCEVAYLFRALRWVLCDLLRDRARRSALRLMNNQRELRRECSPLRWLVVKEAVLQLAGRERQICAALLAGKTLSEIEREMGLTRAALAVGLSRAKARLTRSLSDD
jgi:RNA polymerase sigma factor (sigma-70 family)